MIQSELTCGTMLPSIYPMHQSEGDPWAVVLAGGEGVRLRPPIRRLYGEERPPTADFSRTVLGSSSLALAVAPAPALMWCDLGTPERVARTLRALGTSPAWLATMESRA